MERSGLIVWVLQSKNRRVSPSVKVNETQGRFDFLALVVSSDFGEGSYLVGG